jgi:transcriptional regulator with XRE-family HTH domain
MMPDELDALMKNLSAWCKDIHGRQKLAADEVGVTEQTLSNWIAGRKRPGLTKYLKVQAFLKKQLGIDDQR